MTKSVYLTAAEERALNELVRLNGVSANFVLRVGLQRLLGWPTVELVLPSTSGGSGSARSASSRA